MTGVQAVPCLSKHHIFPVESPTPSVRYFDIFIKMIITVTLLAAVATVGHCEIKQKVLLLSLTSFRPDYVDIFNLSSFRYFKESGVHAKWGMKPSFPTDMTSNLYTLATGLYSESHGIIASYMWDPVFNESFYGFSYKSKWWEGGEPIWITAKKQGKKTAVYSWPGSEAKLRGTYADIVLQMYDNIPVKDQLDTVVDWLKEEDADLVAASLDFSFYNGRIYGTHHEEMEKKIIEVDSSLDYLIYRLVTESLIDIVNFIVVSDHGLINVTHDSEHVIDLSKYIELDVDLRIGTYSKDYDNSGGSLGLWPAEGRDTIVYKKLLHAHPKMKVYTKKELPEHLHVRNNRRCPPLWVFAEEGYIIDTSTYIQDGRVKGESGYSSELIETRAIFYATGPAFKENYVINELESVNVYPVVCHILGIKPAANNGSLKVVKEILKEVQEEMVSSDSNSLQFKIGLLIIATALQAWYYVPRILSFCSNLRFDNYNVN